MGKSRKKYLGGKLNDEQIKALEVEYSGQPTPTYVELTKFINERGIDRRDTTEALNYVLKLLGVRALAPSPVSTSASSSAYSLASPPSTKYSLASPPSAAMPAVRTSPAARSAYSLASPTPSDNRKMVFILGEFHNESHLTDAKLVSLTTHSPYKDYVLFSEVTGPTTKKVFLSGKEVDKPCIPIDALPSRIEGLFQVMDTFGLLKTGALFYPSTDLPVGRAISLYINHMADFKCTEAEVLGNPRKVVDDVKGCIERLCVQLGESTRFIREELPKFTFANIDRTFDKSPVFKASYFLVDDAVIKNIILHNDDDPDVAFIVITGQDHVDNLKQKLLSLGYVVTAFKHGDPPDPVKGFDTFGGRTRKKRKSKRRYHK